MAGNPDIVKHAKKFGDPDGPDPSEAGKKGAEARHGVRRALKQICYSEFDVSPEGMQNLEKQICSIWGGRDKMTGAQILAVRKFAQGMKNPKAMDSLIEAVDGKQVQKVAETKVTLADLVNGDFDDEQEDGE